MPLVHFLPCVFGGSVLISLPCCMAASPLTPETFIDHWSKAEANERSTSQHFLLELTHILGVPQPSNSHYDGYSFEFPVKVPGGTSTNFIDLYRRGHLKRGIIHWLRPEYQNAASKTATQGTLELPGGKGKPSTAKTPWPTSLADRIRATEQALHAASAPVTAEELTLRFSRAKPAAIQEILESLVTLGRAQRSGERFSV